MHALATARVAPFSPCAACASLCVVMCGCVCRGDASCLRQGVPTARAGHTHQRCMGLAARRHHPSLGRHVPAPTWLLPSPVRVTRAGSVTQSPLSLANCTRGCTSHTLARVLHCVRVVGAGTRCCRCSSSSMPSSGWAYSPSSPLAFFLRMMRSWSSDPRRSPRDMHPRGTFT